MMNANTLEKFPVKPNLGFGLGLRTEHYHRILEQKPDIDWFEIITENYLVPGGKPLYFLDKIREDYPMVMHGVSMSLGSYDALDLEYLTQVKALADRIEPQWISDHLCWSGLHGKNTHDLLPMPYTKEAIAHIVTRIQQAQDILGQRILIENVSSYITYQESIMPEWEFLAEISKRADCLILLDVNNIYVSAINHEFNPLDYLLGIPPEKVYQLHLAGHSNMGDYIIDTHDHDIVEPVWDLYAATLAHVGAVATMIERDDNIPQLDILLQELKQVRQIAHTTLAKTTYENAI